MKRSDSHPNGKTLVWTVAGAMTSALFFFSSLFVPLIGSFLGILAPLPLLALLLREGWRMGGLASLGAVFIVGVAIKPVIALYFFVQFVLLGLVAVYLLEKRATFGYVMLVSSLVVMIGFFSLLAFRAHSLHQGVFETLKKPIQENIHMVLENYPGMSVGETREMEGMFQKMLSLLIVLVPVLVVIGSWLILFVNFYLLDRIQLVPGRKILEGFDLNRWRTPDHFIWLVIFPGFAIFFLSGTFRIVALNVLVASLTVYFFQGLCIVNFYLERRKMPSFVKFLIYFTLVVVQVVAVLVVIMGLLDMWLDFRRIFPIKPEGSLPTSDDGDDSSS